MDFTLFISNLLNFDVGFSFVLFIGSFMHSKPAYAKNVMVFCSENFLNLRVLSSGNIILHGSGFRKNSWWRNGLFSVEDDVKRFLNLYLLFGGPKKMYKTFIRQKLVLFNSELVEFFFCISCYVYWIKNNFITNFEDSQIQKH